MSGRRTAAVCPCESAWMDCSARRTDARTVATLRMRAVNIAIIHDLLSSARLTSHLNNHASSLRQRVQSILRLVNTARHRLGVEFLSLGGVALRAQRAPRRQAERVVRLGQRKQRL